MKYIIVLILLLLPSSVAISQVLKITQTSITTDKDGLVTFSSDLTNIPQGVNIDMAVLRLRLGTTESAKGESVELMDNEGKRISVGSFGATTSVNRGKQTLKFLVTRFLQSALANGAREFQFQVKSMKSTSAMILGNNGAEDFELEVYYTPEG